MTETPVTDPTAAPEEEHQIEVVDYCRWCGAKHSALETDPTDWQCEHCERYQDAMLCPVCGSTARVSTLPAEMQPKPAKPQK